MGSIQDKGRIIYFTSKVIEIPKVSNERRVVHVVDGIGFVKHVISTCFEL